jgi:hypothetical protein
MRPLARIGCTMQGLAAPLKSLQRHNGSRTI